MADRSAHADALLDDAIDGRLSAPAQEAFAEHLAVCRRCRAAYEALAWTKREVGRLGETPPPAGLLAGIEAALDQEEREQRASHATAPAAGARAWRRPGPAAAAWLATAAALVLVAAALWWARPPSLPDMVAGDLREVRSGRLSMSIESNRIPELEEHLANRLGFRTPVYELSAMGYRVVGARAHSLNGRPSALSAYRSREGDRLICQMFPGGVGELPEPAERVTRGGVEFFIYRRGETIVVMWQSGPILCALAGDAARDAMLEMAVAKSGA